MFTDNADMVAAEVEQKFQLHAKHFEMGQQHPLTKVLVTVWHGLFMHFSDSNHEIARMQQEEK